MTRSTVEFPSQADPNIEQVLNRFLDECSTGLKPPTRRKYESIVHLFTISMNNYAAQTLNHAESAMFERLYNAEGQAHREFCQIFGPEKIPGTVGEFLDYFMPRKVACGKELMRAAGTVTKRLGKWLAERGYIDQDDADAMAGSGAHAAKTLPAAEELAEKLYEYCRSHAPVEWTDLIEDCFVLVKVEPGRLYVSPLMGMEPGEDDPIVLSLPKTITQLCEVGWDISMALGRTPRGWQIIESGSVKGA